MMMKRSILLATLREFGGNDNQIVVPRAFVAFTGSLESGMMLSQLIYWSERDGGRGRIYKSDAEWQDELCLSRYGVRQARTALEKRGLIKTAVHRANGVPTVHYYLNELEVEKQWIVWIQTNDCPKSNKRLSETGQSLTETTTKTTTLSEIDISDAVIREATASVNLDKPETQYEGKVNYDEQIDALDKPKPVDSSIPPVSNLSRYLQEMSRSYGNRNAAWKGFQSAGERDDWLEMERKFDYKQIESTIKWAVTQQLTKKSLARKVIVAINNNPRIRAKSEQKPIEITL